MSPGTHANSRNGRRVRSRSVAVVGGGFGGVGAAVMLRGAGYDDVTVFERNKEGVTHGWGVTMEHQFLAELGGLDALIHAAGIQRYTPAEGIPDEEWDLVFGINAGGTMIANQAVTSPVPNSAPDHSARAP